MKKNSPGLFGILATTLISSGVLAQDTEVEKTEEKSGITTSHVTHDEEKTIITIETSSGFYVFNKEIAPLFDIVRNRETKKIIPTFSVFPFAAEFYTPDEVQKTDSGLVYSGTPDLITFTRQPIERIDLNFETPEKIPTLTFKRKKFIDRKVAYFPAIESASEKTLETLVLVEGTIPDSTIVTSVPQNYLRLKGDSKNYKIFIGTGENEIQPLEKIPKENKNQIEMPQGLGYIARPETNQEIPD